MQSSFIRANVISTNFSKHLEKLEKSSNDGHTIVHPVK